MPDADSYLEKMVALQEHVLRHHRAQFAERYDFLSSCINVIVDHGVSKEEWEQIPEARQTTFNLVVGDGVSSLVNAIRLALQGTDTDAYVLMRYILEQLTVFDYVVTHARYEAFVGEVSAKARKGEPFSDEFSFRDAKKALGIDDPRGQKWGTWSGAGPHPSPRRLALGQWNDNGQRRPKVGASPSGTQVKIALDELAGLALSMVRTLSVFFQEASVPSAAAYAERLETLEQRYDALRAAGSSAT